jgi:hypothetical protein
MQKLDGTQYDVKSFQAQTLPIAARAARVIGFGRRPFRRQAPNESQRLKALYTTVPLCISYCICWRLAHTLSHDYGHRLRES